MLITGAGDECHRYLIVSVNGSEIWVSYFRMKIVNQGKISVLKGLLSATSNLPG